MEKCDQSNVKPECVLTIKAAVEEALEPLDSKLEILHSRMFVDNGRKSVQSSLSNMSTHIKAQWFFIGGIITAIIGTAVWVIRIGLTP